jgi:diguanylate cyclase (GGDEF)-like protein
MQSGQTLLIIDDNPQTIHVLTSLVEGHATVHFAKGGLEGVQLAKTLRPDVVLLDLDMMGSTDGLGMRGLEICKQLKSDPLTRDSAVMVVTGHPSDATEFAAMQAGAVDVLAKPLHGPMVQMRVQTQLTLQRQAAALGKLVHLDGLTGLFNRRYFDTQWDVECRRHRRQNQPLGLALVDVDHFKLFNDTYDHLRGDDALNRVGQSLQSTARRPGEVVARFGGDEFAIIIPYASAENLVSLGDRICDSVEGMALPHSGSDTAPVVTVSVGLVSAMPADDDSGQRMLDLATQALQRSKSQGRNRAVASVSDH